MASRARIYAEVLQDALEGAQDSGIVFTRFKELVQKRGDSKLAPQILQEFKKVSQEREGMQAQVITAAPLPEEVRVKVAGSLQKKGFRMEEKVNPEVQGGMALVLGSEYIIDGTIKGKLQKLARLFNI